MATHQLGIELGPSDLAAILAFLDALTGEPPAAYIAEPELPDDGPAASTALDEER
jgi:cytochrome c peroxidase